MWHKTRGASGIFEGFRFRGSKSCHSIILFNVALVSVLAHFMHGRTKGLRWNYAQDESVVNDIAGILSLGVVKGGKYVEGRVHRDARFMILFTCSFLQLLFHGIFLSSFMPSDNVKRLSHKTCIK